MEANGSGKHSSFLRNVNNYGRKQLYSTGPSLLCQIFEDEEEKEVFITLAPGARAIILFIAVIYIFS